MDAFVVGTSNCIAYSAAKSFAEGGQHHNPFCVVGPPSSGKTHLLHAIAHLAKRNRPVAEVRYIAAEDFVNALREFSRRENMDAFRKGVRKIDFLLVDDVHFLEAKRWAQGEFLHLLATLPESGKAIGISSAVDIDQLDVSDAF